jgi:hypothetical protein|tara:strand:+ start:1051 stop:1374 length:324 start_codon:yes stop_codon:yes gene_type:complete
MVGTKNNTQLINELAHELDMRELDLFNKEKELELKEAELVEREKEFDEIFSKLGLMEELNDANTDLLYEALVRAGELDEKEEVISAREKDMDREIDSVLQLIEDREE